MTERFEIGDEQFGYDPEKLDWIRQTFNRPDYEIYGDGFMYSTYYVRFTKPEHATLYRLKWP